MQVIKSLEEIEDLKDNRIIGAENLKLTNSDISFSGTGNILYCENGVKIVNSHIKFLGNNCVVYLSSNSCNYKLDVSAYRDSVFYMGNHNYVNGTIYAVISERKNIIIGSENLMSFGIWMRTADPHLIYSGDTHKRINPSKSVFVGDHVWIGQSAMLLKGTHIGSGSIVGAMALCSGKKIASNTAWAGNPARQLNENIFWERSCVHLWDEAESAKHEYYNSDEFMFSEDENTVSFSDIDSRLDSLKSAEEKLEYLKTLSLNKAKNRFSIS